MAVFEHVHRDDRSGPVAVRPARIIQDAHQLLALQRLAGNAAVSGLVAQRQEENVRTQSGGGGGGGGGGGTVNVSAITFRKPAFIQVNSTNGTITDATAQIG
jgi:hypothetical protein